VGMTETWPTGKRQNVTRIILATLLGLFGLWISVSFLPALIWALVIAIAIDPLYVKARKRWPGPQARNWLAATITLAVALLVIVPIAIGIIQAAGEAHDVSLWISAARENGIPPPVWLRALPIGSAQVIAWWQANLATAEGATKQLHHLSNAALVTHSSLIGRGLIHRLIIFAFTLIALFFLLRDRNGILSQLARAGDRLLGSTGERIGRQAILSVRGTIDGLVLVGIGEGAVMIPVYAVFGVSHPILLGALTGIAAIIPFGAVALFGVAALMLLGQSAVGAAIAVIVIGLVIVGIADHFVRPALIGGATRLPFLWVLIGILGGVESFGIIGLFIGPATMAVLVMLWRDFIGGDATVHPAGQDA